MKKWMWIGTFGILAAVNAGFLHGLKEEYEKPASKRITFIAPVANEGYWALTALGAEETGKKLDMDVKCVGFSSLDLDKQISAIKKAVIAKVDGIITAGMEENKAFSAAVAEAGKAGIPVVLVDSEAAKEEYTAYIGSDNQKAGRMAGQEMVKELNQEGEVAVIVSYLNNVNQKQRLEGFEEVLDTYPGMRVTRVIEGESNEMLLRERIVKLLEEQPSLDGIFCAEGYASTSISNLLMEHKENYQNLKVVAFDTNDTIEKALKKGCIAATVEQNPREMGMEAVRILDKVLNGSRVETNRVFTDTVCIRQESLNEIKDYNGEGLKWHVY